LLLKTAVKAKMLTFVLLTEKRDIFFKYLSNQGELEKTKPPKYF